MVEYLLRAVMPLAPLWSQILTDCVTSNAAVESHMRVLKKQLLVGRTRLRPDDFVRLLIKDTASKMKDDLVPTRPVPKGKKRKALDALTHPETQEESWAKRDHAKRSTWYARARLPQSCLTGNLQRARPAADQLQRARPVTDQQQRARPVTGQQQQRGRPAAEQLQRVPLPVAQTLVSRKWLTDEELDLFRRRIPPSGGIRLLGTGIRLLGVDGVGGVSCPVRSWRAAGFTKRIPLAPFGRDAGWPTGGGPPSAPRSRDTTALHRPSAAGWGAAMSRPSAR